LNWGLKRNSSAKMQQNRRNMAIRPCSEYLWPADVLQRYSVHRHTDAYAESPSRAESDSARLVLNGDNMLGLCEPSNFYSFYPPRSDALFSNYFKEDLLDMTSCFHIMVHDVLYVFLSGD